MIFIDASPTTTHLGDAAPALYIIELPFVRIRGIPPLVPEIVAAVHPVPISSLAPPVSARHEILDAGDPVPPPPPPQQIHADPL